MKKVYYLLLALSMASCNKSSAPMAEPFTKHEGRVFICNEGNFMYGNASLSLYDPENKSVKNQLFYTVNNFPLGDVVQSMAIIDGRGFVVVNNSGKVVVIDIETCQYLGTIKGLNSPRYIVQQSATKIYISDLYSRSITIANPTTFELTGSVAVGGSTEQMVLDKEFLYACSWSFNNKLYKIDTRTDRVIDSLSLTKQPNSMTIDKDGKIWVLSDGGYIGSPYTPEVATLSRINTHTFTIEQQFSFLELKRSPSELTSNATRDTLYYLSSGSDNKASDGLYQMDIHNNGLPTQPFIGQQGRLFYGLGIDPSNSEIYLSDAIDYSQKGVVLRYSPKGTLLDSFKVDIIPGAFCFKQAH
ncbi:MAG: DUF5074 domain-containing protein [Mucinivorans sp.]